MKSSSCAWQSQTELGCEFAALLARYPFLKPHEVDRLVQIYPSLRVVDVALMMADHDLAPMLDDFCQEQRNRLHRVPSPRFVVIVLFIAVLAVIAWALT